MKKTLKKILAISLAIVCALQINEKIFDNQKIKASEIYDSNFIIPQADAAGRVGANVPYTRYDSDTAITGEGATVVKSTDFSRQNIATQASAQSYIKLPGNGSFAQWKVDTKADGVTMRFTMPDNQQGTGTTGSLDVYVNGEFSQTVNLTSYYMWQYFTIGSGTPSDKPVTGNDVSASFAFDEVHFVLNKKLNKGDVIQIKSKGDKEYGVDFIEVEQVPDKISQPQNAYNVVDYGASPNDDTDDYGAINNCINAANRDGRDVYFPEGTYKINQKWKLSAKNIKITGAGMWYTNIQFTSSAKGQGGVSGNDSSCKNIEFCNMYLNSNLSSRYNEDAQYKAFQDVFANNSMIHDVWEEHFECGFWLADYNGTVDYSDNLKIVNCRIRNNLADGVNFCQGTSNAAVYNCSIRNNGDDGYACWNNNYLGAKDETGNVCAYNTIEFIWRAGGVAIYGGNNQKIYNNYIADTYMASGIHLSDVFPGYKWQNTNSISFDNNVLVRCGSVKDCWREEFGAVDLKGSIKNITFNNTQIYDAQHEGITIKNGVTNTIFNNTKIFGAGIDGQQTGWIGVNHKGAAIALSRENQAKFDGLEITNIQYDGAGSPYILMNGSTTSGISNATIYPNGEHPYQIPKSPMSHKIEEEATETITSKPIETIIKPIETTTGKPIETTTSKLIEETKADETTTSKPITTTANTNVRKPKKVVIKSATKKKSLKKAKVVLKKQGKVAGYQIKVSTTKKFSGKNTKTYYKKSEKIIVKNLKKNKKYYVKVRGYVIKAGSKKTKTYGTWSKTKKIKFL